MAKRRTPQRDIWDGEDFVDITSHSTGEPPQRTRPLKQPPRPPRPPEGGRPVQKRPPRQRPPQQRPPQQRTSQQRSTQQSPPQRPPRPPRQGGGPPPPRRPQPRKRRPPMKKGLRRFLMVGAIAVMLAATCFLAVSLLFKISEITVTGDLVYQTEDILNLCNYEIGDNLFFVTTKDREEKLKAQLPYIADVEIRRHIPGTLEIHITGTQVACCIFAENLWLYVSVDGKILEMQGEPREGVMRIEGIVPQNPQVGGQVQLEDQGAQEAYSAILRKIVELGAWGEFTRLDITDPYNIVLWYQDRVLCKLGGGAELDYKVEFGYKLFQKGYVGPEETGILDLTYADVRRAGFTSQPVDPASPASIAPEGEEGQGEPSSDMEEEEGGEGRGDDIPDEPMA